MSTKIWTGDFAQKKLWCKCKKCRLYKTRTKVVYGCCEFGKPEILILGEAPGKQEDEWGAPFVGQSGKFLRKFLNHPKIDIEQVSYISNMVACIPLTEEGKLRAPRADELKACRKRIIDLYKIIKPKIIILLGNTALTLIKKKDITKNRGWHKSHRFRKSLIFATFHPAYVLRKARMDQKKFLGIYYRDWLRVKKRLEVINE